MFALALCALAASTLVLLRAWPDRRIGPGQRLAYPWRYYVLLVVGVALWVSGGQGLQQRLGGWVYPVSLALVLAITYLPVIVHNRSLTGEAGPSVPR